MQVCDFFFVTKSFAKSKSKNSKSNETIVLVTESVNLVELNGVRGPEGVVVGIDRTEGGM